MSVVKFERRMKETLEHYADVTRVIAAHLRDGGTVRFESDRPLPRFFAEMLLEAGFRVAILDNTIQVNSP